MLLAGTDGFVDEQVHFLAAAQLATRYASVGNWSDDDLVKSSPPKDAIQMLSDWSRWVVTVEVAAIAAMSFLIEPEASVISKIVGVACLSSFVVSICLASFLLLNLPYFLDENSRSDDEDKFLSHRKVKFKMYLLRERKQVGFFTKYISRFFTIGILLFALTLALQAILPTEVAESSVPDRTQQQQ